MRFSATALGTALLLAAASTAIAAAPEASGPVTKAQATAMSDTQVRQAVEAQGYSNVRITDRDKGHIDVTASKDGKPAKLAVNPQTGQVTPDTDND
jgi:predicted aspartyl protease